MRTSFLLPAATAQLAPPLHVEQWFNTERAPTLEGLRGRVVVLHAFQMLCPGCVLHGLPQAQRVAETFSDKDVVVLGLHSVFEHHDAMAPHALQAFIHEYRIEFPVGVDASGGNDPIPKTMRAYQLNGTPSLVLIDRAGRLRANVFGRPTDLRVGAGISALVSEAATVELGDTQELRVTNDQMLCTPDGCVPTWNAV